MKTRLLALGILVAGSASADEELTFDAQLLEPPPLGALEAARKDQDEQLREVFSNRIEPLPTAHHGRMISKMPIKRPDPGTRYAMIVQAPDSAVDFKMRVLVPHVESASDASIEP